MAHVQLASVTFGYSEHLLLRSLNLRVDETSRMGLVGRNGSGKSTIFELMVGHLVPTDGDIFRSRDLRIGYMQQHYTLTVNRELLSFVSDAFVEQLNLRVELRRLERLMKNDPDNQEYLTRYGTLQERYEVGGGYSIEERSRSILTGLGFRREDFNRPLSSFSGGEQSRAALARLLLRDPNIVLLDEPTNHLDIEAIEWLEKYLSSFPGGLVVITHDRYFLNRVASQILEIDRGQIDVYKGNYNDYEEERRARLEAHQRKYTRQQEMIRRTEDFIQRNIAGQKTKLAQSRRRTLSKLDRIEKRSEDRRSMGLHFSSDQRGGREVAVLEGVTQGFGGEPLLRNTDIKLFRGTIVGLIGRNGCGKSTLLHLLRGKIAPDEGALHLGYNVVVGYYDQQLRDLDPGKTVMEEFWDAYPALTQNEVRSRLGRFLFSGDAVNKSVSVLSGGESARLALAKLMFEEANLLLLDEPTNHLDIPGRRVLEEAIRRFKGTVLFVSHDRYLLDRVVDRIWWLHDQRIDEFLGSYTEFADARQAREIELDSMLEDGVEAQPSIDEADGTSSARLSKKELRRRRANQRRKYGPTAARLEQEITRLEQQLQEIRLTANSGIFGSDWQALEKLHQEEQELIRRIESLLVEWEEAVERESDSPVH